MKSKIYLLSLSLSLSLGSAPLTVRLSAQVIYVNHAATGANNGTSWANAYTSLQNALAAASSGEIWVAAGTYKPTSGSDRSISFVMKNNLAIYGGFAGTETQLEQRDWVANETILSGDIGIQGNSSDNSWHVIFNFINGLNSTAILDGFTITGGNANGENSPHFHGGGMYNFASSPTIRFCTFSGNSAIWAGGAIFGGLSSPVVINTGFSGNTAFEEGGAIAIHNEGHTGHAGIFTNCVFVNNTSSSIGGAIFYKDGSGPGPIYTNCSFLGNAATQAGNLFYFSKTGAGLSPQFRNSIITNPASGTFISGSGGATINDIIFQYTITTETSLGSNGGNNNNFLNTDPRFTDEPAGNLRLQACSPALNSGQASFNVEAFDRDGNPRYFGILDRGAYEFQGAPGPPCCAAGETIIYVKHNATGANNGTSWNDAYTGLQQAINNACTGAGIWVAAGTYKPTTGTNRSFSFEMRNGVAIYGGFNGTETMLSQRDWTENVTILSGDIGIQGDSTDNSYHVISNFSNGLNSTALLDGFTITGGNADVFDPPHNTGGGMLNSGSSPAVSHCIFSGNYGIGGGGMVNLSGSATTVSNCTFSGNSAESGGGMYNKSSSSPVIINCTFSGNSAVHGAGLFNQTCSPVIVDCTFSGNSAAIGGGGIYNYDNSSLIVITGSVFSTNTAENGGGVGSHLSPNQKVTDCVFLNNSATDLGGGMFNVQSSITVINCTFSGNTSANHGGGMFNWNSIPTVVTCTFSGNTTTNNGGGMVNFFASSVIDGCVFSGNQASSGGGMFNQSAAPVITNSIFSGNLAGGGGGMTTFFVGLEPVRISNSTFAGNSASEGAAIAHYSNATSTLVNSILWGNSSGVAGGGFDITYSIVQGGHTGTGNLDTDPIFIAQPPVGLGTSGNLRLQPCSPAINAGKPDTTGLNLPVHDLDGNDRIFGGIIDMGAFELQTEPGTNGILYVNVAATGANNGTSWANAFTNLQDALSSDCVQEIWVAAGSYKPTTSTNRIISFVMKNGVALYGGFAGTETLRSQRNWLVNETVLSGDIGSIGENADNSFHVIFNDNNSLNSTAVLDGFTITGGYANGAGIHQHGGGMYNVMSSPAVTNCIFYGNAASGSGGGMHNNSSSPMVTNCTFTGNAGGFGGAMFNVSSSPTLINCIFSGNLASRGGGLDNNSSSPKVTNCIFTGNQAGGAGGAISNRLFSSQPVITNCTFSGNLAASGAIISNIDNASATAITSSIMWGNSSGFSGAGFNITFSIVQGGHAGTGNLEADPRFVDQPSIELGTGGDLRLKPCSPAINAGKPDTTGLNLPPLDLDGNDRIFGSIIDMGAYELQEAPGPCCTGENILYVNVNATGDNDGSSWANAYTDVRQALINDCSGVTEIWVAAGTYKPTPGTDRTISFVMKNGVGIYGGFSGTETLRSQRNWQVNETILSGDIGVQGDSTDNSFNVIFNNNNGVDSTAVLDGFTITLGNAIGSSGGGGMRNISASPSVTNCIFYRNSANGGGGMNNSSGSSPRVAHCTFLENRASSIGGGMNNVFSSPLVNSCIFRGNISGDSGGGMYNGESSPALTNCVFSGNKAVEAGGGMYNSSGLEPVVMTNCTFSGNSAGFAGGMHNESLTVATNCIFWGNSSPQIGSEGSVNVTYSIVQGGYAGTGNLNLDPLFVLQPNHIAAPTTAGDLRLQDGSPAIDAATSAGAPAFDLDGRPRPIGNGIDIGAYEFECPTGNILYVNAAAILSNGLGNSWNNALTSLQDAFSKDCPGVIEIWVAAGTYKPTTGTDRTVSFALKPGVAVYGGFTGTETMRSQRDWLTNETILSGDIGVQGDSTDNSFHVVFNNNGLDSTAVLDGFTITRGNANGASPHNGGAGMYNAAASPTVTNCIFYRNTANGGGGMLNTGGSSPKVNQCTFSENKALLSNGGGMLNGASSPVVVNCNFKANSAAVDGGGMYNHSGSNPEVINCVFSGNKVAEAGGGMYNEDATPNILNCSFSGNSAIFAGGMYNLYFNTPPPVVTNSIFWGNSSVELGGDPAEVKYSIIQGGYAGTGNLNLDPLFVLQPSHAAAPTTAGDLRLQAGSPATDQGDNAAQDISDPHLADLAGLKRAMDGDGDGIVTIDMGAYELPGCPGPTQHILYVNDTKPALPQNGEGWISAYRDLQHALSAACNCSGEYEIWVAEGVYYPGKAGKRDATFQLCNEVTLYGGFQGVETVEYQRSWIDYETTLSGDIDGDGILNDGNSFHVVRASGTNSTARLDGFIITGGYANGGSLDNLGGGMYCSNGSPMIANCHFTENHAAAEGGAVSAWNNSNPVFTGCAFSANSAVSHGGGAYANTGTPTLNGCTFTGNTSGQWGGGMLTVFGTAMLTGCTFSDNFATQNGGGYFQYGNTSTLTNCTFSGNSTNGYGGGLHGFFGSTSILTGCSFSGNSSVNWGGGIFINGSESTLTDCTFTGNTAVRGGGLYTHDNSTINLTDCGFSGNTAGGQGDAVYNSQNSVVEVEGELIIDN